MHLRPRLSSHHTVDEGLSELADEGSCSDIDIDDADTGGGGSRRGSGSSTLTDCDGSRSFPEEFEPHVGFSPAPCFGTTAEIDNGVDAGSAAEPPLDHVGELQFDMD